LGPPPLQHFIDASRIVRVGETLAPWGLAGLIESRAPGVVLMAEPVLLLSGIPGSGKSTFGRWLQERRGFAHVDMEADGLDAHDLRRAWQVFLGDPSSRDFCRQLFSLPRPVALDWGFPVTCLPLVRALQQQGIRAWWFTGDRLFARINFQTAKKSDPRLFDRQYADISAHWSEISPMFADRVVRTIRQDGSCVSCDQVLQKLVKKGDVHV